MAGEVVGGAGSFVVRTLDESGLSLCDDIEEDVAVTRSTSSGRVGWWKVGTQDKIR